MKFYAHDVLSHSPAARATTSHLFFYNVRLFTIFNDPTISPKFQFIEWLVFAGPGSEETHKFQNSFRQSLLCGTTAASSDRLTAKETELQMVLSYFQDNAENGRLTDLEWWSLLNKEKSLFGRLDAHMTKIYHQQEIIGFVRESLNVSNTDLAKRVEFIMLQYYKPYLLACSAPLPMFRRNALPSNLNANNLIFVRESGNDKLMLFKVDVADRFEFPGFSEIAAHTVEHRRLIRRPASFVRRVISEADMKEAFSRNQADLNRSQKVAAIHHVPHVLIDRTTNTYHPGKKLPPITGLIPDWVYQRSEGRPSSRGAGRSAIREPNRAVASTSRAVASTSRAASISRAVPPSSSTRPPSNTSPPPNTIPPPNPSSFDSSDRVPLVIDPLFALPPPSVPLELVSSESVPSVPSVPSVSDDRPRLHNYNGNRPLFIIKFAGNKHYFPAFRGDSGNGWLCLLKNGRLQEYTNESVNTNFTFDHFCQHMTKINTDPKLRAADIRYINSAYRQYCLRNKLPYPTNGIL